MRHHRLSTGRCTRVEETCRTRHTLQRISRLSFRCARVVRREWLRQRYEGEWGAYPSWIVTNVVS